MDLEQLKAEALGRGYREGTRIQSLGGVPDVPLTHPNKWYLKEQEGLRSCSNSLIYSSRKKLWATILKQPESEIFTPKLFNYNAI